MKCADGAFHSFFPDDLHTLELSSEETFCKFGRQHTTRQQC